MALAGPCRSIPTTIPLRLLPASHAYSRDSTSFAQRGQSRRMGLANSGGLHPWRRQSRTVHRRRLEISEQRRSFHASSPSFATKNPYSVLGVSQTATASDIKKAYYSLAKKYHPDTNKTSGAKDKFTEAQTAYEMLSDPQKKAAWDQFGAAAFDQGGNPSASGGAGPGNPFTGAGGPFSGFSSSSSGGFSADFSFEDLFSAFGGGGAAGGARRGRGGRQNPFQEEVLVGEHIEVQANISFADAASGRTIEVKIHPLVRCQTCQGNGLRKGSKRQECKQCGGSGTRVHFMQGGFQMASTCSSCGGQGVTIPRGSECGSCSGNGVVRESRTVSVDVPGGVEDGMRLRVSSEGDAPPTGTAANPNAKAQRGDLYVFLRVAPDARFSRQGSDVLHTATIPLTTAILGGEVVIPTLDGEVKVKVATGTGSGDRIVLSGRGMRRLGGRRGEMGDLKVEFRVGMPKYLSQEGRILGEMLADELGDRGAKRIMNVQGWKNAPTTSSKKSNPTTDTHKNEGFLKAAWHRLTGDPDHYRSSSDESSSSSSSSSSTSPPSSPKKDSVDESKKAEGSGN